MARAFFALDRLAGQDHSAAANIALGKTGLAIAGSKKFTEFRGIDRAVRQKWRQHNRRTPYDLAGNGDKAAG